jgi:hypothetical protein
MRCLFVADLHCRYFDDFAVVTNSTQATAREYSQSPCPRARLARRLWRPAGRPPAHALGVYHLTLFGFYRFSTGFGKRET